MNDELNAFVAVLFDAIIVEELSCLLFATFFVAMKAASFNPVLAAMGGRRDRLNSNMAKVLDQTLEAEEV